MRPRRQAARILIVCMQSSLLDPQVPALLRLLYLQDASTLQFL